MDRRAKSSNKKLKPVRVRFSREASPEIQYANGVQTTFTGGEFLVSFIQVVPPPIMEQNSLPDVVDGKIIFRAVLTPEKWAEAVDSFVKQLAGLREQGIIGPTETESEDEE